MALYGKQRRISIYNDFYHREFAALFCTDIAARVPVIHWVVQANFLEDSNTYSTQNW